MQQTKLGSLIETIINTAIGFGISFVAWPIAAILFDMQYSNSQHWGIVGFFTVISVARGYVIRRWFNHMLKAAAARMADKLTEVTENKS